MTTLGARMQVRTQPSLTPTAHGFAISVTAADDNRYVKTLTCSLARARMLVGEIVATGSIDPALWQREEPSMSSTDDELPRTPAQRPYRPGTSTDPAVKKLADVLHALPQHRRDFATSLIEQAMAGRRPLSDKQQEWVGRLIGIAEEAMRPAQTLDVPHIGAAAAPVASGIRLDPIAGMFAKAHAAGLKKPSVRICIAEKNLRLSRASDRSKNPGHLYVYEDDAYRGKISPEGDYRGDDSVVEALRTLAADPLESVKNSGKMTGNCALCGRLLTDPRSVANGIGPICQDRWGL